MIAIQKGQVNNFVVTLSEAIAESEIVGMPYYLFEFQNDQSRELFYCVCQDISLYPNRYSEFNIEEKTSPDVENSEIELPIAGYYSYQIFEQSSATNIDPLLCDNTTAIEKGKVVVNGAVVQNIVYDYTYQNKVYNP